MDNKEIASQKAFLPRDDTTQDQPQYGVRKETSAHALSRFSPPYNLSSEKTRTIAGSAAVTPIIEDEGVMLIVRAILNFVGAGVTVTDDPTNGVTIITIPSGAPTYASPNFTLTTANASGVATSVVRSDASILAFDATAPTTEAFSDAAVVGVASVAARRDHKHGMPANPTPAFAAPTIALSTAAAAGAAATVIRSDSTIEAFDATVPVTQAFSDAAATGASGHAARRDHKHGMPATPAPTYGTPAVVLGTAAAAGVIDEVIRRDSTIVAFDATSPTTEAFGDAAVVGVAAVASRRDHKHAMPANPVSYATPSVALGVAAAAGAASTLIRSDSTIAAFDATVPTTESFGDAAATGSAAFAARRDHVHGMPANPTPAFATPSVALGTAAAAGAAGTVIRSDSTILAFDATSPAAEAFGDTAVVGVATVASRRDHRHAMPANPTPAFASPTIALGTAAAMGSAATVIRSDATIVAFDASVPVTQAFSDAAATGAAAVAARRDHVHGMPAAPAVPTQRSFGFFSG